jgi:hypothetical protein
MLSEKTNGLYKFPNKKIFYIGENSVHNFSNITCVWLFFPAFNTEEKTAPPRGY